MIPFTEADLRPMSKTVPFEQCDLRLRQVYDYWQEKRVDRPMPSRRDIDPAELKGVLPYLVLTDVTDGGTRFRYRLFGTAVAQAFGMDPTGRFIEDVMSEAKYRNFILGLYRDIVMMRRPVFSTTRYGSQRDIQMWTERLMLPLSGDGENVDMILTCQVFTYSSPLKNQTVRLAQDKAEPIDSLTKILD